MPKTSCVKRGVTPAPVDKAVATPPPTQTSKELGIEVSNIPASDVQKLRLEKNQGVVVVNVGPDGVGGEMGLQHGDIILELDAKKVTSLSVFNAAVTKANKVIRLLIQRGNKQFFLAGPMR